MINLTRTPYVRMTYWDKHPDKCLADFDRVITDRGWRREKEREAAALGMRIGDFELLNFAEKEILLGFEAELNETL